MTPPIYAVIPTHNRPADLADCVAAVRDQVHHVIVVDNASDPAVPIDCADTVIYDDEQPPNLSRLWNIGIDTARNHAAINRAREWDVLVLNDDVVCGPGFAAGLQTAMRGTACDAASPGPQHAEFHEPGPVQLGTRLLGFAFMLRGETGIRADEDLRWWAGDDGIGQEACARGGRLVVPGLAYEHHHPDQSTAANPTLSEQTHRDMATFREKWGFAPW